MYTSAMPPCVVGSVWFCAAVGSCLSVTNSLLSSGVCFVHVMCVFILRDIPSVGASVHVLQDAGFSHCQKRRRQHSTSNREARGGLNGIA